MEANAKIAAFFYEIADMLDVLGENVFRIRAYRRAAQVIEGYGLDLAEMHRERDGEIEDIPGIGKDLHAKIIEIVETGGCEMHARLLKRLDPGILEILRVRGIGPKKVKLFYEQLGIKNLKELEAAARAGELASLPGMGEKSEAAIVEALEMSSFSKERIPYAKALKIAEDYMERLKKDSPIEQMAYAGSLRRKQASVGDIDLLCTSTEAAAVSAAFLKHPDIVKVLGDGDTKSSVLLKGNVQVDLRVLDPENFGAALLYFTGSKNFNIQMRTVALRKGLKINEYGLFEGEKRLAGETEKGMFDALGMDFVEPEEREG